MSETWKTLTEKIEDLDLNINSSLSAEMRTAIEFALGLCPSGGPYSLAIDDGKKRTHQKWTLTDRGDDGDIVILDEVVFPETIARYQAYLAERSAVMNSAQNI